MIQEFPLGQWLPDQQDFKNPGLIEATNVFPIGTTYEPINGPVASGTLVAGQCVGAIRMVRPDGSQLIVIGTKTDLYTVSGDVVTASELELDLGDGASWSFVPFGRMVWAFAEGEKPFCLPDIVTDAVFELHAGVAPKAKCAARVGDFVFAGNMEDYTLEAAPYRVRWSRFNDPAGDWIDDIATQAGAVDMPIQHGPVIAIAGGDIGLVLQRYAVQRFDYNGSASVFTRREISAGRGCAAPQSVVTVAGATYFLSDDGFFRTDGASLTSISSQRVFSFFQDDVRPEGYELVQGAVDWRTRCIIWSYACKTGFGRFDRQMIYSWESDRWTLATLEHDWLFDTIKSGMTLEQVSAVYPNIDAMTHSLDSPVFIARGRQLSCLKAGYLCNMTGPTLEAVFETGEIQPEPGYRARVSSIALLAENQDANAWFSLGSRDLQKGAAIRWTSEKQEGRDGYAYPAIDGRYVRARVRVPEGARWSKASGLQVEYVKTGRV